MSDLKPEKIIPKFVKKRWGHEIWMVNNEKYCGKILHFDKNAKFSMHYHLLKDESWYLSYGKLIFRWINTKNAIVKEEEFNKGESIHIPPGLPHQLEALEETEIIEISTQHFDSDSHRVWL